MKATATVIGRLTRDVTSIFANEDGSAKRALFTMACNSVYKKNDDKVKTVDFIPCIAWGPQADLLQKWGLKGRLLVIKGTIETFQKPVNDDGSYDPVKVQIRVGQIEFLGFEDNVPLRAKEILDALARAYIDANMESKSKSAERKLNFIDMQLKAIDETIKDSAKTIERYKATNVMIDLSSKAQLTAGKLSDLETQLYEINTNIDIKESILNYIKTHKDIKDIKGVNITSSLQSDQNDAIRSIISEIQNAIMHRNDLMKRFTGLIQVSSISTVSLCC